MSRPNKMAARFGDPARSPYPCSPRTLRLRYQRAHRSVARNVRSWTPNVSSLSIATGQINMIMRRLSNDLRTERQAS